jgi:hypothetical protein
VNIITGKVALETEPDVARGGAGPHHVREAAVRARPEAFRLSPSRR